MSSERHPQPDSPAPAQTSFTPGPWIVVDGDPYDHVFTAENPGRRVCGVYGGLKSPESAATAHLIAAAPSLYAYAKAEQLFARWSTCPIRTNEREELGASYYAHLASMGWTSEMDPYVFLAHFLAAALAKAEGTTHV